MRAKSPPRALLVALWVFLRKCRERPLWRSVCKVVNLLRKLTSHAQRAQETLGREPDNSKPLLAPSRSVITPRAEGRVRDPSATGDWLLTTDNRQVPDFASAFHWLLATDHNPSFPRFVFYFRNVPVFVTVSRGSSGVNPLGLFACVG